MRFSVLGPLAVRVDGSQVDIRARQQRAVLSRLILADGTVVSLDALIDTIWGDRPPREAINGMHAILARLRRLLEPDRPPRSPATVLVSEASGYALRIAKDAVDARRFTDAVLTGREHLTEGRPAPALALLEAGLGEWRGTPYAEFAMEDWAAPEVSRLEELRLDAIEARCTALLEVGRTAQAVPELDAAVREHPLREELWRLLALGLYRSGRQADALAAVRRARARLVAELGVDPGPRLRELESMLLAQDETLLAPAPPPRPAARTAQPLANRAGPLGVLLGAAITAADRPACALISGEAGVGKTWLATRLAESLAGQRWQVAWGRSSESGGRPPMWLWTQALRALGAIGSDHEERSIPDAAQARFQRHAELVQRLTDAASAVPCLLILDDIQWADDASLRLFCDLLTMASGTGLYLVATLRTGEPESRELGELLNALTRAGAERVELTGLSANGVRLIAESSGTTMTDEALERLVDRTGGNPLFVQETLRLAASEGVEAALGAVPSGVADVIRRRVARLSGQDVLTAAAVIGHGGDIPLIAAVTGKAATAVMEELDEAVSARLLQPERAFTHDLIRHAIYTGLPSARRVALHLAVAETLAIRPGADPEPVADHYLSASPLGAANAVAWARTAAVAAEGQLAFDDAARWWARACAEHAAASLPDLSERAELLLCEVRARLDAGDLIGARQARNQAIRVAEAAGDETTHMRALVALDMPGLWHMKSYDEIELRFVRRLETALSGISEEDSELRCRLLGTLGMELYDAGADPRCDKLTAEAVGMARRIGDPRLLAFALNARVLSLIRPRANAELTTLGAELIQVGERHDLPVHAFVGRSLLSWTCAERFEIAEADRFSAECDVQIRRLGLRLQGVQHEAWRVARLAIAGRFDAAQRGLDELWERLKSIGAFAPDAQYMVVLCSLLICSRRAGEITDEMLERSGMLAMVPATARDLAIIAAHTRGDAGRVAELARMPWSPPGDDWTLTAFLAMRTMAVVAAEDREEAERTRAHLLPYSGGMVMGGNMLTFGPVDLHLARLALLLDRRDEAESLLHSCVADAEREGLTWWADQARGLLRAIPNQ
ncbi:BTAD domain-containing putative transcriptional regulator [Sphaerisporangium perillae]|uniref:BTAD domain-containing putative transcriptional regulator n=1 Tax=Sphaerisporangium perillae TaxID=2935860 RepID=UPI002010BB48|nr:BTAD domain-containing putative transcriptional regulator [Sphaerisporangium perillae]